MQPTTFITVSHEIDYELLKIQARSFDLYADRSIIDQIIVIENFTPGKELDWRDELRAQYGRLAPLVRFVRSADIATMPSAAGWWTQMALKLAIAREIGTQWYVALDAKNHLVHELRASYFCSQDGKPVTKICGYRDDNMLGNFRRVLRYKGLDPEEYIDTWMPAITPFVFITSVVRDLIADVERREQRPFPVVFVERRLTDFSLYAAHLITSGVPHLEAYSNTLAVAPVIWPEVACCENLVRKTILTAKMPRTPIFGVHRRAVEQMSFECLCRIADFWTERRLFDSRDEALAALERQRSTESIQVTSV